MCRRLKSNLTPVDMPCRSCSNMLELAALGDLTGFVSEVEERGCELDGLSNWYGEKIGSRKMGFEERTPLMIASLYGSYEVIEYIVATGEVDVNRSCGSDGATALHCAAAGGSELSVEVVKLLIEASADINSVDAKGKKPCDVIAPCVNSAGKFRKRTLEMLLRGLDGEAMEAAEEEEKVVAQPLHKEGSEKKEYPVDVSLPDINRGIYGSDEFRMYSFKVKLCSRAYTHDWTECPFVHPGENARRRDPQKYHYSCVPCPEFKKGTCAKGDACEYAHGVFESWLHPAQYKTRLCKDEIGCARKVCFFAHKPEELRPLHPSTGSAMPSLKSVVPASSVDMATLSPRALGSSSLLMPTTSTPPMSPVTPSSSPKSTNMWQNKAKRSPPSLQLPGSRLKTALCARDLDLEMEMELLGMESIRSQQQQRRQLLDEMASLSSSSRRTNGYGDLKPTNLDDASYISQLQGLSPRIPTNASHLQSPTAPQFHQNVNHLRASYPLNHSPSPVRKPPTTPHGFNSSAAVAAALMNSRSSAFAKRSQSFIDRAPVGHNRSSNHLSDWGSPDGKLSWGFSSEESHKLQKSASFGHRNGNAASSRRTTMAPSSLHEPDVSWVHSLVKDVSSPEQNHAPARSTIPPWIDQLYIEHEQIVA